MTKTPAELGRSDGQRWRKRQPAALGKLDSLRAAHAAGEGHWRRIDRGEVTSADVVTYSQAFLEAALS